MTLSSHQLIAAISGIIVVFNFVLFELLGNHVQTYILNDIGSKDGRQNVKSFFSNKGYCRVTASYTALAQHFLETLVLSMILMMSVGIVATNSSDFRILASALGLILMLNLILHVMRLTMLREGSWGIVNDAKFLSVFSLERVNKKWIPIRVKSSQTASFSDTPHRFVLLLISTALAIIPKV